MTETEQTGEVFGDSDRLYADLVDAICDRFKAMQKPWQQMTEAEQRDFLDDLKYWGRSAIRQIADTIAGEGFPTVRGTIEQVTFKDGIKAVVTLPKHVERRHDLADATGNTVHIVIADVDQFVEAEPETRAEPDQTDMVAEAAE